MTKRMLCAALAGWIAGWAAVPSAGAQDLDPRAYVKVPMGSNVVTTGFSFSSGGVLADPTALVQIDHADVGTASIGYARSFPLFGRTAQAMAALPYTWGDVTGSVGGQAGHVTRSGLSDMRLRLSVLLAGAPAMTLQEYIKSPRKPILGASLTVSAPTGQYYPERLINIGTNRWAFKPEIALSYPLGRRWFADAYAGLWLFTGNGSFYPGTKSRTQEAVGSLQAHISYSFAPKTWVAFDSTWYSGGQARVDGDPTGTALSGSRIGATFVFPVGTRHAVKVAWSTGAIIRYGADFTTFSVGWQTGWFGWRAKAR
jgi:hypothetical protein